MHKLILVAALPLLAAAPASAAETIITPVNWPNITAYCTFQRAPATFVYDDPSTWTWVYFTQLTMDGGEVAYVPINHRLHELELVDTIQAQDAETRQYRTYGPAPYEVTLTMSTAEVGYENTDYQGFLTVRGAGGAETIEVTGGCGV